MNINMYLRSIFLMTCFICNLQASDKDQREYIDLMFESPILDRRVSFINSVGDVFLTAYSSLKLKEEFYGFSWKDCVQNTKNKIISSPNMSQFDFQKEIFLLLSNLRDPHCSVVSTFPSKYSTLPFNLAWVEDKIYITHVDPSYSNSFRSGQQLISMNGIDMKLIAEEKLKEVFGENTRKPNWAKKYIATLLSKSGPRWLSSLKEGPCNLCVGGVQGAGSYSVTVSWLVLYDIFSEPTTLHETKSCSREVPPVVTILIKDDGDLTSRKYAVSGSFGNYYPGCPASFIPPLGVLKWHSRNEPKCDIDASLYSCDDLNIGYLRIGSFDEWSFEELDKHLSYLDQNADVLVLDLMCNTGGSGGRALGFAARFANDRLSSHKELFKVSASLCELGREIEDYFSRATYQTNGVEEIFDLGSFGLFKSDENLLSSMKAFSKQIGDAIHNGKTLLCPAYWMGIDFINANRLFSKPIVILTDDYTMSSAESFLEIIQVNRDKVNCIILGDTTAGVASGTDVVHIPNSEGISGFSYSWTAILSSKDGLPIEDRGIDPDIKYVISAHDVENKMINFRTSILDACLKAIDKFS